jgi:GDPmannose 4,6-dehydratase
MKNLRRVVTLLLQRRSGNSGSHRAGRANVLVLGNLDAERNWSYAPEYVYAMWLMLHRTDLATMSWERAFLPRSVELCFAEVNAEIEWRQNDGNRSRER